MPKEGEIDFGMDVDVVTDAEIDFGIVSSSNLGITLEGSGTNGGVAKGEEAMTMLNNADTRARFMNDLLEVSHLLNVT